MIPNTRFVSKACWHMYTLLILKATLINHVDIYYTHPILYILTNSFCSLISANLMLCYTCLEAHARMCRRRSNIYRFWTVTFCDWAKGRSGRCVGSCTCPILPALLLLLMSIRYSGVPSQVGHASTNP